MERFTAAVRAPEFPPGLTWSNSTPLRLLDLRGKLVLLDFWTAGCINCIHLLDQLHLLEEKYLSEVTVIGVQSPKYSAEADPDNLSAAVERYGIRHPVVNDPDNRVWDSYAVRAWPTLVFVSPDGKVVGRHEGEATFESLDETMSAFIAEAKQAGVLNPGPTFPLLDTQALPLSGLAFPGKVAATPDLVFVADSGHHRIIVARPDGTVTHLIGQGTAGYSDGPTGIARFDRPQGLAFDGTGTLFVADAGNHVVRAIDLGSGTVRTIAGTGRQAYRRVRRGPATEVELSSPWDLAFREGQLFIAMAGLHQIWEMDIARNELSVWAGTGHEALRDGEREQAWFAQPTGLFLDGAYLYVACAEAQAIRRVQLATNMVETLAGTGLFAFGDEDGPSASALLQHCQGVAAAGDTIYIADTYNDKIKTWTRVSSAVATYLGSGQRGTLDGPGPGARFNQPSGLGLCGDTLYIADTNNHLIRTADLTSGHVHTMTFSGLGIDVKAG